MDWFDLLGEGEREKVREQERSRWVEPMLATLTHERFSDPGWVFEPKLDGERCLAYLEGKTALMSRNRKRLDDGYPELVDALEGRGEMVLDGEVVAFQNGVSSFSRLQERMHLTGEEALASGTRVYLYLFDLMRLDGYDLTDLPLRRRKVLLKRSLDFEDPLRYVQHRNEHGEEYYREACERGWEGVIAKRADAPYHGGRSTDWLKFKCVNQQEMVIGGFTDPTGEREGLGALLVGYYHGKELVYAGKVGTGFDSRTLSVLRRRLEGLETGESPFRGEVPEAHFVRPQLVAEVGFTEWTEEGRLRHPRFLGLRRDKDPGEVVREV